VVLQLSHNKAGISTKSDLRADGAKPTCYKHLKEDIDKLASKHSLKASKQHEKSESRPRDINIIDEIRKALETSNCTDINHSHIGFAVKFSGKYRAEKFMFNVYTKKSGKLNTGKMDGCDILNVVWDRPKLPLVPPAGLNGPIDRAVRLVKDVEAGRKKVEPMPPFATDAI